MHTKVFVGNLSFKTKADELAAEFSAAGRVVSANIITRGPRSLGYGFVELESEEEAAKAVAMLNKRSVDGREINVELAKPRDESRIAERRQSRGTGRPRGRGGRGGGGGRGRGPPSDNNAPPPSDNSNNAPSNNNHPDAYPQGSRGGYRPRRYRPRGPPNTGAPISNSPGDAAHRERRPRGPPRGPPRPRDLSNRTPSPTTLFVANLPFALDDGGLSGLFKDLKVSKAHVVKNRNGRSKGFGFVEFANEADQKAALTVSDKLVVDQRELIVKIALTAPELPHKDAAPAAPASTTDSTSKDTPKADAPKTS